MAPVEPEDEPAIARENFQQPLAACRKADGQTRRRPGDSRQDTDKTHDVGANWMIREHILRQQPDNLAALADHDLGVEGKPALDFSPQLGAADGLADDKGARRPDVDRTEVAQLLRQRGRSEGSVTADIEAPQKNDECHQTQLGSANPCFVVSIGFPFMCGRE